MNKLFNKRKINNGVICISRNFKYSCPMRIDDSYKDVILGLVYNDYSMHLSNIFKLKDFKDEMLSVNSEEEASKFANDYGYLIAQYRNMNGTIYLPEFFNFYQRKIISDEVFSRSKYNFSLLTTDNDDSIEFSDLNSTELFKIIDSRFSNICFDLENGFEGYSLDRKKKALKFMR